MRTAIAALVALLLSSGGLSAGPRPQALVLVNSEAPDYPDFSRWIEPYLVQFGVPYTARDLCRDKLNESLGDYSLILIGHRGLDPARRYLRDDQSDLLLQAIRAGTGLVSFDSILSVWEDKKADSVYPFLRDIFHPEFSPLQSADTIAVGLENHAKAPSLGDEYVISAGPLPRSIKLKKGMSVPGISPGAGARTLARAGELPFLIAACYGAGRAILFASTEWISPEYKGRIYGLDDLVWRSFVWAARKPFVMRGMPHYLALRVDDVSGFGKDSNQHLGWVRTANRFNLKPWLGVFIDDMRRDPAALQTLSELTQSGQCTAFVHSRTWHRFFFLDEPLLTDAQGRNVAGRPLPDDEMAGNFAEAEAFFAENKIVKSEVALPHFYEFATNNFEGLKHWGAEFVGTVLEPGKGYGASMPSSAPYLSTEPPRRSNSADPVFIADWLRVPGHPEYGEAFFNFDLEVRDVTGYEWAPSGVTVEEAIRRGVVQCRREWDSMLPAVLFTHESDHIQHIKPEDWAKILAGVTEALRSYQPIPVTLDFLCRYMRAMKTSRIASVTHDPAGSELKVVLGGRADISTTFFVFEEDAGEIVQRPIEVPAFTGSISVPIQLRARRP